MLVQLSVSTVIVACTQHHHLLHVGVQGRVSIVVKGGEEQAAKSNGLRSHALLVLVRPVGHRQGDHPLHSPKREAENRSKNRN